MVVNDIDHEDLTMKIVNDFYELFYPGCNNFLQCNLKSANYADFVIIYSIK